MFLIKHLGVWRQFLFPGVLLFNCYYLCVDDKYTTKRELWKRNKCPSPHSQTNLLVNLWVSRKNFWQRACLGNIERRIHLIILACSLQNNLKFSFRPFSIFLLEENCRLPPQCLPLTKISQKLSWDVNKTQPFGKKLKSTTSGNLTQKKG